VSVRGRSMRFVSDESGQTGGGKSVGFQLPEEKFPQI